MNPGAGCGGREPARHLLAFSTVNAMARRDSNRMVGRTEVSNMQLISIQFLAPVLTAVLLLAGCNSAAISDENTRLRREHLELTNQVAALKAAAERRDSQIAALAKQATLPKPAVEGVKLADLPVVSKLEFGGYSGGFDSNGDGTDDTVRVYLQPLDQRGRFYPAVGKAVLQVVAIDADKPPVEVAKREYDPKAFDDAYVAGFTGTHFTLETKMKSIPAGVITIKVTFTDGQTGAVLTQQLAAKLKLK